MKASPTPKLLRKQKWYEVTCVFNSYVNFYQSPTYTEKLFQGDFKDYWTNLPSTLRLSAPIKKIHMEAFIGPMGYSMDVLKLMLHRRKHAFVEMGGHENADRFDIFVRNIENGFISIRAILHGSEFSHCVCVRKGYLLDSIYGERYPWEGFIHGYEAFNFQLALDCDQSTPQQDEKNYANDVIDLTEDL